MLMKRIGSMFVVCALLSLSIIPAVASGYTVDSERIIEVQENVTLPENVSMLNNSNAIPMAYEITYDHDSDIVWEHYPANKRRIEANTQAKQGSINISSYTRARFERAWFQGGGVYGDSGRCWSATEGSRSYATSGWDKYDMLSSGQAKTYYGI